MPVIQLNTLGGVRPSVSPRALPDSDAQVAHNLLARTTEFRPLQNDVAVATSAVGNPQTLYRMARDSNGNFTSDMSTNWRTHAEVINYVKGQVNDERTERTYYTYGDGSQPPRVVNASGFDKPLGVPVPATAPTGVVVTNYSYTPEQRTAELTEAGRKVAAIIRANVRRIWAGIDSPTYANPWSRAGYITIIDPSDTKYDNPDRAKAYRVFQVDRVGGTTVVNTFSAYTIPNTPQTANTGIFDPRLGGIYATAAGDYSPPAGAWASYGMPVYAIPIYAYAPTLELDTAAIVTACRGIKMPGTGIDGVPSKPLFTDEQVTALCAWLVEYAGRNSALIKPMVTALKTSFEVFMRTVDAGQISSVEAVVQKQNELRQLYQNVVDAYARVDADLLNLLAQFYNASGVDATVPPGVPRILEDRFYVCTYVTDWGEESAPSPVSLLAEVDQNDTVTGSPPNPPSGYGITKFRYYRSNSSNTGAAFQFVDEVTFSASSLAGGAATTVTDTKKSTELGEVCPTLTWLPPPYRADLSSTATPKPPTGANPYLRGLVGMPNGIMLGFFDNTVCPSENYIPYAYPVEYQMTTEYPVVGIGVFGQTAVITTQGNPYYCSGSDAASLSLQKIETPQACVSARSIASSDGGVIYASPDGLCMASSQGVQLITEGHFTHEDWTALNPSSIVGAIHEFTYYFLYNNGTQGCYALHMGTGKLTTVDVVGTAFYSDMRTDRLYVVNGNTIKALFADPTHRTAKWRSKVAVSDKHSGFAWLAIESSFEAPITVRWYGDGSLVYTATVTSRAPVRLPAGRYLEHEIEVESSARWNKLTFASSTAELQKL